MPNSSFNRPVMKEENQMKTKMMEKKRFIRAIRNLTRSLFTFLKSIALFYISIFR